MDLKAKLIKAKLGTFKAVASEKALVALVFEKDTNMWPAETLKQASLLKKGEKHKILDKAERELNEYFKGERTEFSVPLELHGTDMQKAVWKNLLKVKFGELKSYGDIAKSIGRPKAARAVGGAVGRNNIPIIIPCHRIVGSKGALTGFGLGLPMKKSLVFLEGVTKYS